MERREAIGHVVRASIIFHDPEVVDALCDRPGVRFLPIEQVVARAQATIRISTYDQAEAIYRQLDEYYFRHAGEDGRRAAQALGSLVDAKQKAQGTAGDGE